MQNNFKYVPKEKRENTPNKPKDAKTETSVSKKVVKLEDLKYSSEFVGNP